VCVCVCVCVCVFWVAWESSAIGIITGQPVDSVRERKAMGWAFWKTTQSQSENVYIYILYTYYIHIYCDRSGGVNSGESLFISWCDIKTTKRSITQLMSAGPNSQSYSSKIALDAHIYTMLLTHVYVVDEYFRCDPIQWIIYIYISCAVCHIIETKSFQ